MKSAHVFKTLPKTDKRQNEQETRAACAQCGALRSPGHGGGYVYSWLGLSGGPWEKQRPRCVARDADGGGGTVAGN